MKAKAYTTTGKARAADFELPVAVFDGTVNEGLPTGEIEVGDCDVEILRKATPPPFPVDARADDAHDAIDSEPDDDDVESRVALPARSNEVNHALDVLTIIEAVVLISIVGIMGAVAAPRFLVMSDMDATQARREALGDRHRTDAPAHRPATERQPGRIDPLLAGILIPVCTPDPLIASRAECPAPVLG